MQLIGLCGLMVVGLFCLCQQLFVELPLAASTDDSQVCFMDAYVMNIHSVRKSYL
jgi:hypothetical protein